MEPFISVIIPLYNGELYIEKCLDSVKGQNYSSLEVIVVNDASTDNSEMLVREYKRKSGLKLVLINQENQGQGAARNTGIRQAKGEFLVFLDQDDTLTAGILEKMVETAGREQADIVAAGYRRVTDTGKVKKEVRLQQTDWSKYKAIAPWAKLYRTEFIKKNQIVFLPVVLGEDIYFLMQAYSYMPKVVFLSEIGYNWLDNAGSVSNTVHKNLEESTSLLTLYEMLEGLENIAVLKEDRLYEYFLLKTAVWDILYTAGSNGLGAVKRNSERIWDWFSVHCPDYLKNPYIRIGKPQGESAGIRLIVWGYMKAKRWGLEKFLLWLVSRKGME